MSNVGGVRFVRVSLVLEPPCFWWLFACLALCARVSRWCGEDVAQVGVELFDGVDGRSWGLDAGLGVDQYVLEEGLAHDLLDVGGSVGRQLLKLAADAGEAAGDAVLFASELGFLNRELAAYGVVFAAVAVEVGVDLSGAPTGL